MKKVIILIMIFLVFCVSNKDRIVAVFGIEEFYEIYYLDFKKTDLNTNNFESYFNNNIDIIKIEPYVNPLYKKKIVNTNYSFDYNNTNYNINKFKNKYLDLLKNNNYLDDYNKYLINGIKIELVKVYAAKSDILNLIKKDNKIKYYFTYNDYQNI